MHGDEILEPSLYEEYIEEYIWIIYDKYNIELNAIVIT